MRKIKARVVTKDIKRLKRLTNGVKHVKHLDKLSAVVKRIKLSSEQVERPGEEKQAPSSPVIYAQHQSVIAMKTMIRGQKGIILPNNRLIRCIQQRRKHLGHSAFVTKGNSNNKKREQLNRSTTQSARKFVLQKPNDGKYRFLFKQQAGQQRFIHGRVNARLLHVWRDQTHARGQVSKQDMKPAGKKAYSTELSQPVKRRVRHHTDTPEMAGYKIKQKARLPKTLTSSIKTGQRVAQGIQKHSNNRAQHKLSAVETAKHAASIALTTRRNMQRAQAAAKLNFRIIQLVVRATALLVKGVAALLGVSSSVIILLCAIMAVAAVVASPFGIFVSKDNTDADIKPLSQIVEETEGAFAARMAEIKQSAGTVVRVDMLYVGSADNTRIDNWADIIAVFAVKTVMNSENGMDVATLDATRAGIIQSVFWEMNLIESRIETIEHQETVTIQGKDGSTSDETTIRYEHILHITVTSRTATQQAAIYHFTSEQTNLMKEMLSAEFRPLMLAMLGKDADTGLTSEQLEAVEHHLPEGKLGSEAVKLALTRLGDPYSQPLAGQDSFTDCSYLVQWIYRQLGINLPRTAAEQAKFLVEHGLTISATDLVPGDLVFWSYEHNGRFMDITHVGIYAGDGKVVDASSTRGQVVYRNLFDSDKQALFGRPYHLGG